jgi:hypothetical protein
MPSRARSANAATQAKPAFAGYKYIRKAKFYEVRYALRHAFGIPRIRFMIDICIFTY